MARGDKNYKEVVRKVNKGAKSKAKVQHVHKMVEAMITGDTTTAEEELTNYIRVTSRKILLGESSDECKCECDDDCDQGDDCKCANDDSKDSDDEKDDSKDSKKK